MTDREPDRKTGVHYCSPTNSTLFTDCCNCAVVEEEKCPSCGARVVPESNRGRHSMAMSKQKRGRFR